MRVLYALVGFIFDLVIIALSCAVIYALFNSSAFDYAVQWTSDRLANPMFRLQAGAVAAVFFMLGFRVFFLLATSGEKVFAIRQSEHGSLTVSRRTLEHLLDQLADKREPRARISDVRISQQGQSLRIGARIKIDMSQCNIKDYVTGLESDIQTYFKDSLGIEVSKLDIRAEPPAPGKV